MKDKVGMTGSKSTQTRFVIGIITYRIHPYTWLIKYYSSYSEAMIKTRVGTCHLLCTVMFMNVGIIRIREKIKRRDVFCMWLSLWQILFVYFLTLSSLLYPSILFNCFLYLLNIDRTLWLASSSLFLHSNLSWHTYWAFIGIVMESLQLEAQGKIKNNPGHKCWLCPTGTQSRIQGLYYTQLNRDTW